MYVLVDTCVFMDLFTEREPYHQDALNFFMKIKETKSKIFVAPTTFKDIYYFAFKNTHDKEYCSNLISKIYSACNKVLDITADDTINALFSDGDFEDNILIEAAKRKLLDCIVTRNIKDYKDKNIRILTPKEFVEIAPKPVVIK